MLQIPFDAFNWTLKTLVPLCLGIFIYMGYRKKNYFRWFAFGIATTVLLFVPSCIIVISIIAPSYTHVGALDHSSKWDDEVANHKYRWVELPSNSTDIVYFKNTAGEYFNCVVERFDFISWCQFYNMTISEDIRIGGSYPDFYSTFLSRGVSEGDENIRYSTKMESNGRQMRAIYYPSSKLMYYEENYW